MSTPLSSSAQGHLAMLAFAALVGGSFPLGAMVAPYIDPAALTALRLALASLLLWAVAFSRGEVSLSVLRAPWRHALLAALYATYFTTMFEALKTTNPVSLAAVFTLSPALTGVFGYLILRQITTRWMALAIAVGGAGALWVIFDGSTTELMQFAVGPGEWLYFWGCLGHAFIPPLLRKLNRGEPAMSFTAAVFAVGATMLAIWSWPELRAIEWAALPRIVWVTLAYSAVFTTALSFSLMRFASLRLPAAKVMAYTYLVPSAVILWELALARGVPHAAVIPGVMLTVIALVMLLKRDPTPAATPRDARA